MKVILENFGPIKRVEFDLTKELNVIFGKNNIGKSYAITALYIILKHLLAEFGGESSDHERRLWGRGFASNPAHTAAEPLLSPIETVVEHVREAFNADQQLTEYNLASPLGAMLQEMFAVALEERLSNSFNNSFQSVETLSNGKSEKPLSIRFEGSQFTLGFCAQADRIILDRLKMQQVFVAKKSDTPHRITHTEQRAEFHFWGASREKGDPLADLDIVLRLAQTLLADFRDELRAIAHASYFLPASRSGLYQGLSNLSNVLAELSQSRSFITKNISLPGLSEPVADYFLQLSSIKPSTIPDEVAGIARQMERDVLGGEVIFNEQNKKLYFRQQLMDYEMDLAFASSMISEIAPVVAYCKYILGWDRQPVFKQGRTFVEKFTQSPSLLFIEEPEAHLHPEVQVKLMEFFARLTKHNVKVIMTSHSNYMFNKLSNLLLTGELEPEKVGSYLMRATPEGSVMDAAAMRAEEEGIADENFVDVAEQLYNERLAAYDKLASNE